MTRREMNGGLAAAVAALFASGPAAVAAGALAPSAAGGQRAAPRRGAGIRTLMQEPLGAIPNPEVSVITLTMAPGASSRPHEHIGPVFAYILEGEIENQVDPNPPRTYRAGDYFYEPAMHVHRMMRNLSATRPAKLLIFQVAEKGKQFTIPVRS
ncbi:MAG TPA: cupin domain-containing protein [Terriglobales bacterium]|nr:cupin domain-containing protein [Terriglobales bacterium]